MSTQSISPTHSLVIPSESVAEVSSKLAELLADLCFFKNFIEEVNVVRDYKARARRKAF